MGKDKSIKLNQAKRTRKVSIFASRRVIALTIIVMILGTFLVANVVAKLHDKQRFADALKRERAVVGLLRAQIGVMPIGSEDSNVCYNSEQGPYDKGKLWCQVAGALYYAEKLDVAQVKNAAKRIVVDNGWATSGQRAADVEFKGAKDLPCGIDVLTGAMAQKPGYYLPDNKDAKTVVVFNCSDRARAKYYPYIK